MSAAGAGSSGAAGFEPSGAAGAGPPVTAGFEPSGTAGAGAPRRGLVLAGGGIRVAWQAGVVRALHEHGLTFAHGDGTSGGTFTLAMLLSGVSPAEMGDRWRTLNPRRTISLLPLRRYLGLPTDLPAIGDADGLRDKVFPHLGIDIERIRATTVMTGSFNVADFTSKTCVAIPHDELDLPRLIAGVSLPIFLPAVRDRGRVWTDAVWIKDANPLEAVRRGCTELWVLWCIANTPYWGNGALEQYVHMIEMSANSSLFADLAEIAAINERRRRGEEVLGSTEPVVVHLVKPEYPLPLDPDFLAGRITADTLVAMGYRDARRYLAAMPAAGISLDPSATVMREAPLGARFTLRARGSLGDEDSGEPVELSLTGEVTDLRTFGAAPAHGTTLVGWLRHAAWGPLPLEAGRFAVEAVPTGRRFVATGLLAAPGGPAELETSVTMPATGRLGALRRPEASLVLHTGGGNRVEGRASLSPADLVRLALSFEPSGAHNLRDRVTAACATARFLRRAR